MTGRADTSYYDVLEVSTGATGEEIEASYRRILADLESASLALYSMVDDGDMERLRGEVDEAYRTLSDPARRAAYDRGDGCADEQYPPVLVPEEDSGASVSVGRVEEDRRAPGSEPADAGASRREDAADAPRRTVRDAEPAEPRSRPRGRDDGCATTQGLRSAGPSAPASTERSRCDAELGPKASGGEVPRRRRRRFAPSVPVEISADTEFSGALLRRLRESAGATHDDIAELTKISKRYIKALEANDFDTLPAPVYVRGFVSEYARVLGLDAKAVSRSYVSLYKRYRGEGW
jgi:curved DNA-binding protein CbpA